MSSQQDEFNAQLAQLKKMTILIENASLATNISPEAKKALDALVQGLNEFRKKLANDEFNIDTNKFMFANVIHPLQTIALKHNDQFEKLNLGQLETSLYELIESPIYLDPVREQTIAMTPADKKPEYKAPTLSEHTAITLAARQREPSVDEAGLQSIKLNEKKSASKLSVTGLFSKAKAKLDSIKAKRNKQSKSEQNEISTNPPKSPRK